MISLTLENKDGLIHRNSAMRVFLFLLELSLFCGVRPAKDPRCLEVEHTDISTPISGIIPMTAKVWIVSTVDTRMICGIYFFATIRIKIRHSACIAEFKTISVKTNNSKFCRLFDNSPPRRQALLHRWLSSLWFWNLSHRWFSRRGSLTYEWWCWKMPFQIHLKKHHRIWSWKQWDSFVRDSIHRQQNWWASSGYESSPEADKYLQRDKAPQNKGALEDICDPLCILFVCFFDLERLGIFGMRKNDVADMPQNVVNVNPMLPRRFHTNIFAVICSRSLGTKSKIFCEREKAFAFVS